MTVQPIPVQFQYLTVAGPGISLINVTPANVISLSLGPGDWQAWGNLAVDNGVNSSISSAASCITTSSGNINGSGGEYNRTQFNIPAGGISIFACPIVMQRFVFAVTTPVYLVAYAGFSAGTVTASGILNARKFA